MCFVLKSRLTVEQADLSQALFFSDSLISASITYRRETPRKVTIIFAIFQKFTENRDSERNKGKSNQL